MRNKTIKKLFTNIIFPVVTIIVFVVILGRIGYWENHYVMTATVVEVENENIFLTDTNGNLWECSFDTNDFIVGDIVKVTMFDSHTHLNIYDDEIERVEKIS